MILIFGGTTEGRLALRVLDAAGTPFFYSTKDGCQQVSSLNAKLLSGAMDECQMADFCRENDIRLIVDAAHPFASRLHATVSSVASELSLPVVRLERQYPGRDGRIRWCRDYEEALRCLESDGITRLLALTGVRTIPSLKPFWSRHECYMRILDRDSSRQEAALAGFDPAFLVYYTQDDVSRLIDEIRPQAILTKESGESGGFEGKVAAALASGIGVYAVQRPPMPEGFETVTGEFGLRKAVERLLPGFFPLRSGFTTGACATAASRAALMALLGQPVGDSVSITFPDGEVLDLPVNDIKVSDGQASAAVVKDAGDDPDVTNGHTVISTVRFSAEPGIKFLRGEGVGVVTLPGLGLAVGGPAINRVPRQMICDALSELFDGGLEVEISIPGGRELALKTFNPKVGVVDGISIIGTSGIVRPFSHEAFVDAIRKEVEVFVACCQNDSSQPGGSDSCQGCCEVPLVLNSGARSEAFLKARYVDLPPQAFVHYGNYIGDTLRVAGECGVRSVVIGVMIGKAVKLAEGHLDTHSRVVTVNHEFLQSLAREAGCSDASIRAVGSMVLAREIWTLTEPDLSLMLRAVHERCLAVCRAAFAEGSLKLLLISEDGRLYGD